MKRWSWVLLFIILVAACDTHESRQETSFARLSPRETGIDFRNNVESTEDFNIIEYLYFYNGAGVAAGDINNDGLPDLYFAANQEPNRLYINRGNFRFEDISETANVPGKGNWKTGVAMADVNGDGFLDIFSCGVGKYKKFDGANRLYINNGDLTFTDKTEEYRLTFSGFSTQAAFFDYDNDGDLDMFLLNHSVHSVRSYRDIRTRLQSDPLSGDKLYRNDMIPSGVPGFTEVTSSAGIFSGTLGYGLGVAVSDLNRDGYQDIYVTNDFHENDYLYINNGDGTFRQELENSTGHASRFSMGVDIGDLNGDGWSEIFTVDMLPSDEHVIKTTAGEDPFEIFSFKLGFGFHHQYSRNCLQLNNGLDSDNKLIFSDIAAFSGIEATDWSWSPLMVDFDNDGTRELFVTAGIAGRPNDLDFINYIESDSAQRYFTDQQLYQEMPGGEAPNVIFRRAGGMKYENVTASWIGREKGLSNGAAIADFDGDGDADIVTNNFNDAPYVYKNELNAGNSVRVRLAGAKLNRFGIGAKVIAYVGGQPVYTEQSPVRGFMSSSDYEIIVGTGSNAAADSIIVVWPGGTYEVRTSIAAGSVVTFKQEEASGQWSYDNERAIAPPLLTPSKGVAFTHREDNFIEFESQRLIPHTLSTQGPGLAKADVNRDGLEDVFIGGAAGQAGVVFLQTRSGLFTRSVQKHLDTDSLYEDTDACFFDANGDGAPDLVVVAGISGVSQEGRLQPRLYLNNGRGEFSRASFPSVQVQASVVATNDVDNDGDADVFIGGRALEGKYGAPVTSYLFLNDGKGNFSEAPANVWTSTGEMITDAAWADINHDGNNDLVLVGDWMGVRVFINNAGKLEDRAAELGLSNTNGWWQCVTATDIDNDGLIDLIVGNMGSNSRLRPTATEPVELYAGDIDNNGSVEQVMSYYNGGVKYPFISRDQLVRQVPPMKKKYLHYRNYADVKIENIIPADRQNEFTHRAVITSQSVVLKNTGTSFTIIPLAEEAQWFPIFDFQVTDINADGNPDLLAVGNLFDVQAELGRFDAGYGLLMLGNGDGTFKPMNPLRSGFVVPGEGRGIAVIRQANGNEVIVVARSNGEVLSFARNPSFAQRRRDR